MHAVSRKRKKCGRLHFFVTLNVYRGFSLRGAADFSVGSGGARRSRGQRPESAPPIPGFQANPGPQWVIRPPAMVRLIPVLPS